jgi:inorganic pyrophosphatase
LRECHREWSATFGHAQIEQFFVAYNAQEGKTFKVLGRHRRKRAESDLKAGQRNYRRRLRT